MAEYFTGYRKSFLWLAIVLPLLALLLLGTPAQAAPVITLSPTAGAIGTKVIINGINFDSYKGDSVSISLDDTKIFSSPLTIPATGTFVTEFNIPGDAAPGRHWVRINSELGTASLIAESFFIVEEAEIKLDVADGPVGTEVTVRGFGLYAGRTVTVFYYDITGEKLGITIASPIGEFSYRFTVPNSTAGKHKVTAANAEGNLAETEFEVIPSITPNLTSAGPGELLSVKGTGFGYRSEVEISFGNILIAKVMTSKYGDFEIVFNIPELKPATYDVKAQDEHGNTDKARFTTTSGFNLNQTTGPVGFKLIIRGSGFKVEEKVTIDYDNLRVATAATDNNGDFTTFFNIPPSRGGSHVITVSDDTITKQLTFTVESEAPPVPRLLLPTHSGETRARAYLDWQDITDPSLPVTYHLQVASDQNFSALVLEKEGLTDSEYTLPKAERLAAADKYAPYYWRVKAGDSAANESEWSASRSFYVSAPPVPALLLPTSDSEAEAPIFFNWQDVANLSPPMTYHLQVATDLNFTAIALEKEGLKDSEYFLSEEDDLSAVKKKVPYYWRVKAIDNVNNESEWSAAWSFYTGTSFTMPGWLIYTIISILVVAVGYVAFRMGKQTAYRPQGEDD